MGLLENLIRIRIYTILSELCTYLESHLKGSPYDDADVEKCVITGIFSQAFKLTNDGELLLKEEYDLIGYQLHGRYYYAYTDPKGNIVISFDNSPHHSYLSSYPHHKHLYPKHKHPPVSFSGDLRDALEEIKWFLEER